MCCTCVVCGWLKRAWWIKLSLSVYLVLGNYAFCNSTAGKGPDDLENVVKTISEEVCFGGRGRNIKRQL